MLALTRPKRTRALSCSVTGTVRAALTLVELLVVLAILLVLSVIGFNNYQAAQVRSRVAAAKGGLREISSSLQRYAVDWNAFPPPAGPSAEDPFGIFAATTLGALTTPVAYASPGLFRDPFGEIQAVGIQKTLDPPTPVNPRRSLFYFDYPAFSLLTGDASLNRKGYCAASVGPDTADSLVVYFPFPLSLGLAGAPYGITDVHDTVYDPTNGAVSRGDLAVYGGDLQAPPHVGGGN